MKYLPWAIAIAFVFAYGCQQRRVGELNGRISHLVLDAKRLDAVKRGRDTVYLTRTKTLTKVRVVTDSLLRTDTLFRVDTVRQIIAAERQACDAVVLTCEQRVADRDSIIANRDTTIAALKGKASVWAKLPWFAGGILAGVVLTR